MLKKIMIPLLVLVMLLASCAPAAPTEIKIGLDVPMTGDIAYVGTQSQRAAEMKSADVNDAGGLDVGGKKYKINIIVADNESKAESATAAATKLIAQDKVLAIVGPQASKQAGRHPGLAHARIRSGDKPALHRHGERRLSWLKGTAISAGALARDCGLASGTQACP